jgi:hypothetical protein
MGRLGGIPGLAFGLAEASSGLQLGNEAACVASEETLVKWARRKLRAGNRGGMALSVAL